MYKGRYFIRETVYICGDYMDAEIYPVFQPAGKRRKKCKPTSEVQTRVNQRNAEKKITRLIHENFNRKDIAMHLTYDIQPESKERAQRDLYNYIRRVNRAREKAGLLPTKYISCTEIGGRGGRFHHHIIMSGGLDRDMLEQLWGKGFANSKRLQFGEDGVTGLAHYIVKDKQFFKRWNASRNLIQPAPMTRDGVLCRTDMEEMAAAIEKKEAWRYFEEKHKEFLLTDAKYTMNEVNKNIYIQFDMRRRR